MKPRIAALLVLALFLSPTPVSPDVGGSEAPPPQDESRGAFEDFVPTEELPADSEISFPVDI